MFVAAPFKGAQFIVSIIKNAIRAGEVIDKGGKALAITKLLKEHGDSLLSGITAGIASGKLLLEASAGAICSESFDVGKLQEFLDKLPKQALSDKWI